VPAKTRQPDRASDSGERALTSAQRKARVADWLRRPVAFLASQL
jgi:hypothetical protein